MYACNVSLIYYMNIDQMIHKRATLTDDPVTSVYLDNISIGRYKDIIASIQETQRLFRESATCQNNHAAQAAHVNKMKREIKHKLKAECRHDYVERDTGTSCSKCRMRFN